MWWEVKVVELVGLRRSICAKTKALVNRSVQIHTWANRGAPALSPKKFGGSPNQSPRRTWASPTALGAATRFGNQQFTTSAAFDLKTKIRYSQQTISSTTKSPRVLSRSVRFTQQTCLTTEKSRSRPSRATRSCPRMLSPRLAASSSSTSGAMRTSRFATSH